MKHINFYTSLFILSMGMCQSGWAEDKLAKTKCGESSFEIKGIAAQDEFSGYAKIILIGKSKAESIRLVFDNTVGGKGGGDHFLAACAKGKDLRYYLVFQNFYGGSASKDYDNYGIIDAKSLMILLAPNDSNRKEASVILGVHPEPFLFDYKDLFF